MRVGKQFFGIVTLSLIVLGGLFLLNHLPIKLNGLNAGPNTQTAPLLADGTLIRSARDERVYFIDNGHRRWITSSAVLSAQGLRTQDILTLSGAEADLYPEGEAIDLHTLLALPKERGLLPDIAPLAPYHLLLGKVNGRTVIKFTGSFWNMGQQAFDLVPGKPAIPATTVEAPVYERIIATDGSERLKLIDNFIYHPAHHHLHLIDFGYYVFSPVRSNSGVPVAESPFVRVKTTFCMRDDQLMIPNLPGAPLRPVFKNCGTQGQGVSVGWIDVYPSTLSDQYVDVQDMPPGIYSLSFMLDPEQHYLEDRKDNNIGTTFLELDVQKKILRVIASIAPFATATNNLPENMLVRSGGDTRVYVIHNNKKRWVQTAEIFNSYGYSGENIYTLTPSMMSVIADNNLVRLKGTEDVYTLNAAGYYRHILNATIFNSYGFAAQDIANINQTEFANYREANLIMLKGGSDIYLIAGATKQKLGTFDSIKNIGYNPDSLQIVNETDFNAYATVN